MKFIGRLALLMVLFSLCIPVPSPDLNFQPDEHLEVFVSASENPNHFWIQILGVRSLQLDKLTEEMNRFYKSGNIVSLINPDDYRSYTEEGKYESYKPLLLFFFKLHSCNSLM